MNESAQRKAFNILRDAGIIPSSDEFVPKQGAIIREAEEFLADKGEETARMCAGVLPGEVEKNIEAAAEFWDSQSIKTAW